MTRLETIAKLTNVQSRSIQQKATLYKKRTREEREFWLHSAFDMSEGIDNSLVDVYLVLIDFKLTEARSALKDDFA